jgi:hypothetical protein
MLLKNPSFASLGMGQTGSGLIQKNAKRQERGKISLPDGKKWGQPPLLQERGHSHNLKAEHQKMGPDPN